MLVTGAMLVVVMAVTGVMVLPLPVSPVSSVQPLPNVVQAAGVPKPYMTAYCVLVPIA